jgi:hypothetical protein
VGYSEQIDQALAAHEAWKLRLKSAVASGASDFTVAQVQVDNACEFGKWFYDLEGDVRSMDECQVIQKLHAEFHSEAARILDLALKGNKQEAEALLGAGSKYSSISGQLAMALTRWKRELGG